MMTSAIAPRGLAAVLLAIAVAPTAHAATPRLVERDANEDLVSLLQVSRGTPAVLVTKHTPPRRVALDVALDVAPLGSIGYVPDPPETYDAFLRLGGKRAQTLWRQAELGQENTCVHGRLAPEVYVLGAPKCGTSSIARDLRAAGVASNAEPQKEKHFFDVDTKPRRDICSTAKSYYGKWLALHPRCPADGSRHIIGDYTPNYLSLTPPPPNWTIREFRFQSGVVACTPAVLQQFYQELSSRLTFVIMVREPLSRYHSQFYFRNRHFFHRTALPGEFEKSMQMSLASLANNTYDDFVWTGMYARPFEEYLKQFSANQFFVIPYLHYFSSKCAVFSALSARLAVPLRCAPGDKASRANSNAHPPLGEDLSAAAKTAFEQWMAPETDRFVSLLANASLQGLALPLYNGTLGSDSGVRVWLEDGW